MVSWSWTWVKLLLVAQNSSEIKLPGHVPGWTQFSIFARHTACDIVTPRTTLRPLEGRKKKGWFSLKSGRPILRILIYDILGGQLNLYTNFHWEELDDFCSNVGEMGKGGKASPHIIRPSLTYNKASPHRNSSMTKFLKNIIFHFKREKVKISKTKYRDSTL